MLYQLSPVQAASRSPAGGQYRAKTGVDRRTRDVSRRRGQAAPAAARLDHDIGGGATRKSFKCPSPSRRSRTRRSPGKYQPWSRADVRRAHADCQFDVGMGECRSALYVRGDFGTMTNEASRDNASNLETTSDERSGEAQDKRIPDESSLVGRSGVEEEVLAELARAEARMSDGSAPDDPDARGAQV